MKKIFQFFFSVTKENNHKIWTILGIKFKFRNNKVRKYTLVDSINLLKEEINNINYKQNLILDYFIDIKDAHQATGQLRQRQLDEVKFLNEFIRVCDKYAINYWLDFGTLLGAKRHGGFVPWDDDLDVSMLQKDLYYFNECWKKENITEFEFLFWEGEQSRIIYKEDNGSFMDIYAYQDLEDRVKIRIQLPIPSMRSIPKDIMFPCETILFEGLTVKCPKDIDSYLRVKYGNYDLLPKSKHNIPGHNPINEYKIFYPEEFQ